MTDERKPAQNNLMWTRFYVLFSINQIIVRELVPFERWYQEAILHGHVSLMHRSFVTTVPPTTGKGRDYDFSAFSALL